MKLEGVNRRFGDRDVLKDVNLNFDKNGMVFILGASGSGKSTLLNVLGLLDGNTNFNSFLSVKCSESCIFINFFLP